ncbi:Prefoldin subunit 6, KE2 family [Ceraceosorus bombacis]|uniref:Prefoldin subunit 6, KE2 family n=1 Tax=Ceraceosorus bombacis TaxID=401625 RepID=A0A0P1BPP3_9BASI|nr:Prefoldin subunit 6, KE2 family [Ceraceosorus bombacis]
MSKAAAAAAAASASTASSSSHMQQLERSLQKSSVEFQNLQAELEKAVDTRQTLAGQLNENESVLKEFDALPNKGAGAKVYKAMGPVLLQQDPAEAKSNVQKRIDFIQGDIRRAEMLLKELSEKGEKKKEELVRLQSQLQAAATGGPGEGADVEADGAGGI